MYSLNCPYKRTGTKRTYLRVALSEVLRIVCGFSFAISITTGVSVEFEMIPHGVEANKIVITTYFITLALRQFIHRWVYCYSITTFQVNKTVIAINLVLGNLITTRNWVFSRLELLKIRCEDSNRSYSCNYIIHKLLLKYPTFISL